jgi:hypothetical protein
MHQQAAVSVLQQAFLKIYQVVVDYFLNRCRRVQSRRLVSKNITVML